jgi:hypothetical protein
MTGERKRLDVTARRFEIRLQLRNAWRAFGATAA